MTIKENFEEILNQVSDGDMDIEDAMQEVKQIYEATRDKVRTELDGNYGTVIKNLNCEVDALKEELEQKNLYIEKIFADAKEKIAEVKAKVEPAQVVEKAIERVIKVKVPSMGKDRGNHFQ